MQNNQDILWSRVEEARKKLYQTQRRYGHLTHPKVVEQSVILDELLNQFPYKQPAR